MRDLIRGSNKALPQSSYRSHPSHAKNLIFLFSHLMELLTSVPLISLLIFLFIVYKLVISAGKHSRRLPPGPRALPFVGNLLSLSPELHSHFQTLAESHGPIFRLWLGHKLGVVVTSPSLAREVLRDNDVTFANRDVPVAGRVATNGGTDVVWTPYGDEWRMLRKVCVVKMLSHTTLDSVYGLRRREIRAAVGRVYSRAGTSVDVGELAFSATLNVITNMLWGGNVGGDRERAERIGSEFRGLVSRMTALLGKPNVSDFYPALARFDLQGVAKEMGVIAGRFDRIFDDMIAQRNKEGGDEKQSDFLQYLLKLKDEDDSKTPLTLIHVKALLMDMVVGGSDTSSNTVEFAMAELMKKPEMMKKAQREVEEVVGRESVVEEAHISKLPYLRAVMKETLRLHPTLPLLVPHSPSRECTVGGHTVPAGSRVFVNVWAIHRDPSLWPDPERFDPERFLGANNAMDFAGSDFSYFPFGSGRRICAGVAMAERMVLYTLATLLHSFDWDIPAGDTLDLSEKFGIVLKKRAPLVAVPTPRLSSPSLYS